MAINFDELIREDVSPADRARQVFTPERAVGQSGGIRYDDYTADDSGLHGYWRKPDGEITISGYGDHEFKYAVERGMMPLRRYGLFPLTPRKGDLWQPNTDPFRQILATPGGINEFTAEQIIMHQWHIRPHPELARLLDQAKARGLSGRDAIDEVFPQLRGMELEVFKCEYAECRNRTFTSAEHLRRHEVIHQDDFKTRQLREGLQAAMETSGENQMKAIAPILEAMLAAQVEQQATNRQFQAALAALLGDRLESVMAPAAAPETNAQEAPARCLKGHVRCKNSEHYPTPGEAPAEAS